MNTCNITYLCIFVVEPTPEPSPSPTPSPSPEPEPKPGPKSKPVSSPDTHMCNEDFTQERATSKWLYVYEIWIFIMGNSGYLPILETWNQTIKALLQVWSGSDNGRWGERGFIACSLAMTVVDIPSYSIRGWTLYVIHWNLKLCNRWIEFEVGTVN